MSTTIQLTAEYPTIELSYGADFVSGEIFVKADGAAVNLTGYEFLWQFRVGRGQTEDLVASLALTGGTAGTSLTVTAVDGIIEGFIPFSVIDDEILTPKPPAKIWHDMKVTDPLGKIWYWWRGVILLIPNVTTAGS